MTEQRGGGGGGGGRVLAVLDVDSDELAAFSEADVEGLEGVCGWLGRQRWCSGLG